MRSAPLKHLKERGLKGVQLIISDACMGHYESAAEFYPDAGWQRCTVHWYRNIFSHVPAAKMREVADMLKAIHASEDRDAADKKVEDVITKLKDGKMSSVQNLSQIFLLWRSGCRPQAVI